MVTHALPEESITGVLLVMYTSIYQSQGVPDMTLICLYQNGELTSKVKIPLSHFSMRLFQC